LGVVKYDIAESGLPIGSADYELSILLGVDSFTYLILDTDRVGRAYRSYDLDGSTEHWPLALQRLTTADELLREIAFKRIHVGWIAGRTTLVPSRLFAANQRRAYLEQLTDLQLEDRIWSVPIESLQLQLVYALNNGNFDAAERRFVPSVHYHLAAKLLGLWQETYRDRGLLGGAVFALVRDRKLLLAGMTEGGLQFFNTFSFRDANDALYYLLLAFEQSGFDAHEVPLFLCGELMQDGTIFRTASRYIARIEFLGMPENYTLNTELSKLPAHFFYDLFSLVA
jgi:hypothetical protein